MKAEDKVIPYQLAKKIWETAKKKKVKLPESEWGWFVMKNNEKEIADYRLTKTSPLYGKVISVTFPAYDTAELLAMTATMANGVGSLELFKSDSKFGFFRVDGRFRIGYSWWDVVLWWKRGGFVGIKDRSLSQALGKLLLYLLENDLWRGKEER